MLEYVKQHVPKPAQAPLCGNSIGTDRRFLDQVHERARRVPALPQHRRVVAEGAVPALVPGRVPQAAGQGRAPPRARRHSRVDRRAALLPRQPAHPATGNDSERSSVTASVEGAEERGDRALAGAVAHEADAPTLAGELAEPPPTSMSKRSRAARRGASRRRRLRGATPTVSCGRRRSSAKSRNPSSGSAAWSCAPTCACRAHDASSPSSSSTPSPACSA